MMPPPARSARWPWLRSVVCSLIVVLSPAVWVAQATSCSSSGSGTPVEYRELTGVDLAFDAAEPGSEPLVALSLLLATVLICAMPFFAAKATTPARRLGWHAAGLLFALVGAAAVAFAVTFTIFYERIVRVTGHVVLVLALLPVIESIVRIVYGAIEVRAGRAHNAGADVAREGPS